MRKVIPAASLALVLSLCFASSCSDDDNKGNNGTKTKCEQACAQIAACGLDELAKGLQACSYGDYFLTSAGGSCHECKAACYANATCGDLGKLNAGPDNPISNDCLPACYSPDGGN